MKRRQKRSLLNVTNLETREVPSGSQLFAVAEDAGSSRVAVYSTPIGNFVDAGNGTSRLEIQYNQLAKFAPYPGFGGGVRVALGDVTGDGVDDLVTAPGLGGGPHIKIYDGAQLLNGRVVVAKEFFAFDGSFRGGVFVAVGQMDPASPQKEIIVGAGESGGPHVRVFAIEPRVFIQAPTNPQDYYAIHLQSEFFAFGSNFRGGVRVAAADVTGDGRADVVAAAGPGGGPHVRVFDVPVPGPLVLIPYSHKVVDEFFAYGSSFRGGVFVTAGELDGNTTRAEVVTSPGTNEIAEVKAYSRDANGKLALKSSQSLFNIQGIRVGIGAIAFPAASVLAGVQYVFAGFQPAEVTTLMNSPLPITNKIAVMSLVGGTLSAQFTGTFDVFSDCGNAGIFVGV